MPGPRSSLFPHTTPFRSLQEIKNPNSAATATPGTTCGKVTCKNACHALAPRVRRSEERFSRNAGPEILPLSPHDALPISPGDQKPEQRRHRHPRHDLRQSDVQERLPRTRPQGSEIGRAVQQECRARDPPSFPTRRPSDLSRRSKTRTAPPPPPPARPAAK